MPFRQSQRALDFMLSAVPEQRRCSRVHLPVRATIAFPESAIEPHTALLRDVNMLGAFFYCKQRPSIGQIVRLDFAVPENNEQMKVICEGRVVRVEEFAPGAAIGVAAEFTRYELARSASLEKAEQQPGNASFIRWTVEMVERVSEKSGRFTGQNCGCEQAA